MNLYLYLKHFPLLGDDLNEGTRKAVHGLATGLVYAGVTATILCEGPGESTALSQHGYMIRCFSNPKSQASDAIANSASFTISPGLEKFVRELPKDSLFILNGIFHRSVYSLSRLLKKHSLPYVVAPHDPYHPAIFEKNPHLKIPYWHLVEKRLLQQAIAIQVLDRRHGQYLKQRGVHTPVIEVPNGFMPEDVQDESSLEWRSQRTASIFFLGRLDAHNKGLDLLLQAFSLVADTIDANLTIQGPDWGDRQQLETQAKQLGLGSRVTFLQPDYTSSSSSIIARHDVFCIPSRFEGFSLSALEAMLAGRTVVISEIAGLAPHVLASQCGIVVQPTVDAIAASLQEAMKQRSKWREIGMRGRDYALKHLDWQSIGANALKDYECLMAKAHQ